MLSSIENATGSRFGDLIWGDAGNNVLDGGDGGADQINGAAGSDTVNYAASSRAVIVDLTAQLTWDGAINDLLSSIDKATGSRFNDLIWGDAGNNILDGAVGRRSR